MTLRWVKPPRLQPGMTIGVVSPSGTPGEERLAAGVAALQARGYRVVLGEHVRDHWGYLAGSDEARAADFTAMFARPDVDAVFCSRGGYGAVRMLDCVDWSVVARSPKLFVGYSDITSLHLALERRAGLATIHGPMVTTLGGDLSDAARDCFWRALTCAEPLGLLPADPAVVRTLVRGRAAGRLAGGCLELLAAAVGTPDAPDFAGRIVAIEDVGIATYRADRALMQLRRAGLLEQAAGFIVGALTDWRANEGDEPEITPESLWETLLAPLGKPAVVGFPFGHEPNPLTLPLGCAAELDADARTLTVLEPAVS